MTASAGRPPAQASLTTGALARMLGVSPTTVRSWERRYGIGPARRDPGRHRQWSPRDVAVLAEMCRLTARGVTPAEAARLALAAEAPEPPEAHEPPPPAGAPAGGGGNTLPVGTVRPECRGLARAAVRLDAPELARILRHSVDTLGPVAAWTEVMMPALRAAGRKWAAEGERYVEVEHLLSWHVAAALRRAADRVEPPQGPAVLLAGMPAELHALPLEALAAGLAERGLPFRMFGPALPTEALLEAVRRTGPPAVLLWSQVARTADRALARRVAETAWGPHGARTRPVVLTAGPGWTGSRRPPGALRPRDLPTALDQLEHLLR
ncbi:MerR family transcriptional regulator [Kitasatospora sp. NBC_01300]|uniref:MerR family transcriptional regulator n=1 Tax=Kitasatospora sp. NBC_01300 TaxID=2903574 RepID=UPI00352D5039|nr:MerR family transcriptional regulator [Kitasatospora sp. NBC_01300]